MSEVTWLGLGVLALVIILYILVGMARKADPFNRKDPDEQD